MPGLSPRVWLAPFADRDRRRPRRLEHSRHLAVPGTAAKIVKMRAGDPRQPYESSLAELFVLAPQNVSCGRPAQALVRTIHLGQQHHIPARIGSRKPAPPVLPWFHLSALTVHPDEPRHLRQAPSGHFAHPRPDGPACLPVLPRVLLRHQHLPRPGVDLRPALSRKLDSSADLQKLLDLSPPQFLGIPHL